MARSTKASREAVARGVELLDAQGPSNWRDRITRVVETENPYNCVLGQVYGYWLTGLPVLGIKGGRASEYGFNIPSSTTPGALTYRRIVGNFDAAWREALR